jgi:short-subunit dehydrogenase
MTINRPGVRCKDAHIVVTGATGGIGKALARELSRRGSRVTLVGRRERELKELAAEINGAAICADLADVDRVGELPTELSSVNGPVDVLINNAAIVVAGPHAAQTAADVRTTLLANLYAPLELTRQCLPLMLERNRGAIVNVSALAGEAPLPNTASYATTKAGISQFTINLQRELRRTPVTAMLLVLGSVEGTTLNDAGLKDPVLAKVVARFNALPALKPEFIARRTADAIEAGRQFLVLPRVSAPAVHFRQLPGRLTNILMRGVD